jgi:hypothetical protein
MTRAIGPSSAPTSSPPVIYSPHSLSLSLQAVEPRSIHVERVESLSCLNQREHVSSIISSPRQARMLLRVKIKQSTGEDGCAAMQAANESKIGHSRPSHIAVEAPADRLQICSSRTSVDPGHCQSMVCSIHCTKTTGDQSENWKNQQHNRFSNPANPFCRYNFH